MQKILPNNTLSKFYPWNALVDHQKRIATTSIKDHFKKEPNRLDYTWFEWEDFTVDVSKNRIDKTGFELLLKLADKSGLKAAIEAQFTGQKINVTENRAVLHTALRALENSPIYVEDTNVIPEVRKAQEKMYTFCEKVICGDWKGHTGKSITHIVNL